MSSRQSMLISRKTSNSNRHSSTVDVRQDVSPSKKRTRGPTMCMPIWGMQPGERIQITVNDLGQPTGDGSTKLGNFLGTLARNAIYAPLHYEDWRLMPKHYKTTMWNMVQEKFDVDIFLYNWVMTSLNKKWGRFKSNVKSDWINKKTKDTRVCDEDWRWLLEYWSTEKAMRREKVGKENRKNMLSAHTMGTKSYARFKEEMKRKRPDKSEPTRAELYIASHVRPGGKPLNDKVAKVIEKLKDKMQAQPPTSPDSSGPNEILSQVLEDKPYYSRAYGLGPNWGIKNSRCSIVKAALEAKKNAEDKAPRVEEKLNKVLGQQDKILALLHKDNPNLDLDEIMDEPNENEIPNVGESDELGTGPLLPLLQSSTAIPETQLADDETPNCILDTFIPLRRTILPRGGLRMWKCRHKEKRKMIHSSITWLTHIKKKVHIHWKMSWMGVILMIPTHIVPLRDFPVLNCTACMILL
ncbi:unnamed protein product [Linum trigynum]|uniref:Transposase n=1 Tax=Linum trigynum TaxID=586398 RepID=A0AAV2FQL5_9ROSI